MTDQQHSPCSSDRFCDGLQQSQNPALATKLSSDLTNVHTLQVAQYVQLMFLVEGQIHPILPVLWVKAPKPSPCQSSGRCSSELFQPSAEHNPVGDSMSLQTPKAFVSGQSYNSVIHYQQQWVKDHRHMNAHTNISYVAIIPIMHPVFSLLKPTHFHFSTDFPCIC